MAAFLFFVVADIQMLLFMGRWCVMRLRFFIFFSFLFSCGDCTILDLVVLRMGYFWIVFCGCIWWCHGLLLRLLCLLLLVMISFWILRSFEFLALRYELSLCGKCFWDYYFLCKCGIHFLSFSSFDRVVIMGRLTIAIIKSLHPLDHF